MEKAGQYSQVLTQLCDAGGTFKLLEWKYFSETINYARQDSYLRHSDLSFNAKDSEEKESLLKFEKVINLKLDCGAWKIFERFDKSFGSDGLIQFLERLDVV